MKIENMHRKVYSLQQKIIEFTNRNNSGPAIYMFHQVNNEKSEWLDESVCITENSFHIFIETLKRKSIHFYSIEQLEEHLDDSNAAFLTFDDIFLDAYENALEYLEEQYIPYTVFITENYIGQESFISEEQFNILSSRALCTIGYHTKSHPMMRSLNFEDMKREIEDSGFCNYSQKQKKIFAFPYGSLYACTKKSITVVEKCGYDIGFSTIAIRCNRKWYEKSRWFLPRINVNESNYLRVIK